MRYLKPAAFGWIVTDGRQQIACDKRAVSADEAAGQTLSDNQRRNLRRHGVCRIG